MSEVIYLNGTYVSHRDDARVSVLDRGYLLGDAVFETVRAYSGTPFRLDRHIERLRHSAQVLGLMLPPQIDATVRETLRRSELASAYIRITLSRGVGPGGLSSSGYDHPTFSVLVRPFTPYPAVAYSEGIETMVVDTRRVPAPCLDPTIKSTNYLPSILARRQLDENGMIEGVQLGIDDQVVCGTVSNLFIVRDDALLTPSLASGCLPGITRQTVLEVATMEGLPTVERRLAVEDLYQAREMFFTNTLMECLPVSSFNSHTYLSPPGPHTTTIRAALSALIWRETHGGSE